MCNFSIIFMIMNRDEYSDFVDTLNNDDVNIWSDLLGEVQGGSSSKLPTDKALLILGDNNTGKTSLLNRLKGKDVKKGGQALEYHYVTVRDDYREDRTNLAVWILNGDTCFSPLLDFSLTATSITNTIVLLVASMEQPWDILPSLQKWADILREHIHKLDFTLDKMKELEQTVVRMWQDYTAPDETSLSVTSSQSHGSLRSALSGSATGSTGADEQAAPLGEGVLTCNLGVQIIVVITKTDTMSTLEKEMDYREEHFDFIQHHIREFCVKYGASLFYVSSKDDKNMDPLYRFLMSRLYNFHFSLPAQVVDRDSIFIPAGWDNERKISILYENLSTVSPQDSYSDIITKPTIRKAQRDGETVAENEQDFLQRVQHMLSKQPVAAGASPLREGSPARTPGSASPKAGSQRRSSHGARQTPDSGENTALVNFFNSLLNRKSGGGVPPTSPNAKAALASQEPAAELERLRQKAAQNQQQKNQASPSPSQPKTPTS